MSDVHGNAVALEAVIADLARRPVDAVVCLGDMLQGGPQPAEVADRLVELDWPVVLGNADAFLLDPAEGGEPATDPQLAVRAWSVERLGEPRLELVRGFASTIDVELADGLRLLACHGSPSSFDDFLFPDTPERVFRTLLGASGADVVAGGHVHLQFLRRVGATLFVNPGSVGLSYDHEQPEDVLRVDPWAAYAVVEVLDALANVMFRRVPLDVEAVAAAYVDAAHPDADAWAARWLGR